MIYNQNVKSLHSLRILSESDCDYLYHDKNKKVFIDNMTGHAREFEEDRFFPVTKAIEIENIY